MWKKTLSSVVFWASSQLENIWVFLKQIWDAEADFSTLKASTDHSKRVILKITKMSSLFWHNTSMLDPRLAVVLFFYWVVSASSVVGGAPLLRFRWDCSENVTGNIWGFSRRDNVPIFCKAVVIFVCVRVEDASFSPWWVFRLTRETTTTKLICRRVCCCCWYYFSHLRNDESHDAKHQTFHSGSTWGSDLGRM